MTHVQEENLLSWAARIDTALMRPLYVFRMARANPKMPGARKRMLRAASEIEHIVDEA